MQKILVTGGAGFIGSAFVRMQLRNHPEVHIVNFDKLTYAGNLDNLQGVDDQRHTFIQGDIADADALKIAMQGCDGVVNFAADTHVDRSIHGASDFINTNVTGVHTLLTLAQELKVSRILLVSTDEVYGSIASGAFRENDPLHPRNPYAASKASGELFAQAHFKTYGTPVIVTRGSNTYGAHQHLEKFMPLFITNALDNEKLPLYGDGLNVRDWLYVEDHCRGIDCALRKGTPGETYNISGSNERQNIAVVKELLALLEKPESLIEPIADRPGHDRRYAIDDTKLRTLGWQPETSWQEGIARTVAWYTENENWWRKVKSGEFKEYYQRQYGKA